MVINHYSVQISLNTHTHSLSPIKEILWKVYFKVNCFYRPKVNDLKLQFN